MSEYENMSREELIKRLNIYSELLKGSGKKEKSLRAANRELSYEIEKLKQNIETLRNDMHLILERREKCQD